MRLGMPWIQGDRTLKFRTRRGRFAKCVVSLAQRIVRLGRFRKQPHRLAKLRNRFGALPAFHQDAAQQQPGVRIARIGFDQIAQQRHRLLLLALRDQLPRLLDSRLLRHRKSPGDQQR